MHTEKDKLDNNFTVAFTCFHYPVCQRFLLKNSKDFFSLNRAR